MVVHRNHEGSEKEQNAIQNDTQRQQESFTRVQHNVINNFDVLRTKPQTHGGVCVGVC